MSEDSDDCTCTPRSAVTHANGDIDLNFGRRDAMCPVHRLAPAGEGRVGAVDAERFCVYGCACPTYEPERCSDGPCECKCHPTESAFTSDESEDR